MVHVGLLVADSALKAGGGEEASRVGCKYRSGAAQQIVDGRRHRRGHGRDRPEHAGHRVGPLGISRGNEIGIEAVVGHGVHAVNGPQGHTAPQQQGIVHPSALQQQIHEGEDARAGVVQGIDHLLSAHSVQVWTRQQGHDHHGQLVADVEEHIEKRGARVVQHHQTDAEAGQGGAHHGDEASNGDDREIIGPQLVLSHEMSFSFSSLTYQFQGESLRPCNGPHICHLRWYLKK